MAAVSRVDDLFQTYQEGRRAGRAVTVAGLCRDCPELREELQRRIDREPRPLSKLVRRPVLPGQPGGPPPAAAPAVPPEVVPPPEVELGPCGWFVGELRRSNLVERDRLGQAVTGFLTRNPGAEAEALAGFLVGQGLLTPLQADRVLRGGMQGFDLGPFTLTDALGTGSMGTLYKARSRNDDGLYAIKVVPRRSLWNVRLAMRWVRQFAEVTHPAVVPFVDVGTSGNTHYLAWHLVEGEPLDRLVARQGKLAPAQAAQYALQAAEGLDACHRAGLFHGYLKASNLLVGPDGAVYLLDTGIGCLLSVKAEEDSMVDTMSTANAVNSALDCASPESILEPTNLTPAGDQYSLGCVLYFCLTGRYPFHDRVTVEKMVCHQVEKPAPVKELAPEVPEALAAVVERLMQKDPAARYANCAEVADALRAVAAPAPHRSRQLPRLKVPSGAAPSHPVRTLGALPPRQPSKVAARLAAVAGAGSAAQQPAPVKADSRATPAAAAAAGQSSPSQLTGVLALMLLAAGCGAIFVPGWGMVAGGGCFALAAVSGLAWLVRRK